MSGGQIVKAGIRRKPYEDAMNALRNVIESPDATFDIGRLSTQIVHECVWPSGRAGQQDCYGGADGNDGYCAPLISRINSVVAGPELRVIFQPKGENLLTRIGEFLAGDEKILRISLASVPYIFNAREIVANAFGRRLLSIARTGALKKKPVVVFLDEAHNFLNRHIGEEDSAIHLDAFDQIAKEGRKHWLTICLATQRPRDLPEGVLSQMGTMIVHRLINGRDRDVVECACRDIDRAAVSFLTTLAPGQAPIVGVDFPFPLTITLDKPSHPPDSSGPDFQSNWT
jgi:DNA helicase HerA-like ATPase